MRDLRDAQRVGFLDRRIVGATTLPFLALLYSSLSLSLLFLRSSLLVLPPQRSNEITESESVNILKRRLASLRLEHTGCVY